MLRSDVLNYLINKRNLKSYLEIGTRNKQDNFNLINIENKICIDPDINAEADFIQTSDEFFESNTRTFDLIFIDGLHKSFQVEKDIRNSLKCLNKDGIIVLHDCNPTSYEMQIRDVDVIGEWTGDVWKAFVKFRIVSGFLTYVVDTDYGCGVIDTKFTQDQLQIVNLPYEQMSYFDLEENRKFLLNLLSVEDFTNTY
jgi:hypothetical protein